MAAGKCKAAYHKGYEDKRVCDCGQKLDWD